MAVSVVRVLLLLAFIGLCGGTATNEKRVQPIPLKGLAVVVAVGSFLMIGGLILLPISSRVEFSGDESPSFTAFPPPPPRSLPHIPTLTHPSPPSNDDPAVLPCAPFFHRRVLPRRLYPSAMSSTLTPIPKLPVVAPTVDKLRRLPLLPPVYRRVMLEMANDLHTALTNAGAIYGLCGGGTLGGTRHHGLIPWDGDLDFCMQPSHGHLVFDDKKFRKTPEMIESEGFAHTPAGSELLGKGYRLKVSVAIWRVCPGRHMFEADIDRCYPFVDVFWPGEAIFLEGPRSPVFVDGYTLWTFANPWKTLRHIFGRNWHSKCHHTNVHRDDLMGEPDRLRDVKMPVDVPCSSLDEDIARVTSRVYGFPPTADTPSESLVRMATQALQQELRQSVCSRSMVLDGFSNVFSEQSMFRGEFLQFVTRGQVHAVDARLFQNADLETTGLRPGPSVSLDPLTDPTRLFCRFVLVWEAAPVVGEWNVAVPFLHCGAFPKQEVM